jgi:16S rRNA (guanine527-N7)-methyltransferase
VSPDADAIGVLPDPPAAAVAVFGEALPVARRYAAILAGAGIERGVIGPREVPRLWERHILNCAVLAPFVGRDATVCDIGSGAGLPGLVLALQRPDCAVALVEPLLRRSVFLTEVVSELRLPNVEVVRGRAEDVDPSRRFDVVTARAVAPLDRLAAWGVPLLRSGGRLIAIKGEQAYRELEQHRDRLAELGVRRSRVRPAGSDILGSATWLVELEAGERRRGTTGTRPRRNRRQGRVSRPRRQ